MENSQTASVRHRDVDPNEGQETVHGEDYDKSYRNGRLNRVWPSKSL